MGIEQISALPAGTSAFFGITAAPGTAGEVKKLSPCLSLPAHPAGITTPGSLEGMTGQQESTSTAGFGLEYPLDQPGGAEQCVLDPAGASSSACATWDTWETHKPGV